MDNEKDKETAHWRCLQDMQHKLLGKVAQMIYDSLIKSTLNQHFGTINASNLLRTHALLESGQSRGKVILSSFD